MRTFLPRVSQHGTDARGTSPLPAFRSTPYLVNSFLSHSIGGCQFRPPPPRLETRRWERETNAHAVERSTVAAMERPDATRSARRPRPRLPRPSPEASTSGSAGDRGRAPVLAIVGPGQSASPDDLRNAATLGALAAGEGWIVVNGGVASGVMDAASRGARSAGGTVIGILPDANDAAASPFLSVAIVTAMGQARNNVIVLSSDALAVCGMSPGTAVEAAHALRARRPIVFVAADAGTRSFFRRLDATAAVHFADSAQHAGTILRQLLTGPR